MSNSIIKNPEKNIDYNNQDSDTETIELINKFINELISEIEKTRDCYTDDIQAKKDDFVLGYNFACDAILNIIEDIKKQNIMTYIGNKFLYKANEIYNNKEFVPADCIILKNKK